MLLVLFFRDITITVNSVSSHLMYSMCSELSWVILSSQNFIGHLLYTTINPYKSFWSYLLELMLAWPALTNRRKKTIDKCFPLLFPRQTVLRHLKEYPIKTEHQLPSGMDNLIMHHCINFSSLPVQFPWSLIIYIYIYI